MKRKLKIICYILSLSLILGLCACTHDKTDAEKITLTDQTGRMVTLDGPAQSVVSCYYVTSHAMLALGLGDRLIGIEKKPETRPVYAMSMPSLLELPQVGTMKECNVEAIAELAPDLVLMPKKLADYARALEELNIAVIVVEPEDHEKMCEMLTLIASACAVEDRAKALIDFYDEKSEEITKLVENTASLTVYMGANSSYLSTVPNGMYQDSLLTLAGAINVGSSLDGEHWVDVSYETVLSMDPEVIIIPAGASYSRDDIYSDTVLESVTAVKNNAVYTMPSQFEQWDSPIPSGILGAYWIVHILHPEIFTREDFSHQVSEFYKTFYGFEPEENVLNSMYE